MADLKGKVEIVTGRTAAREHERDQRGTPYRASTPAGTDGKRQPSEHKLGIAQFQGRHMASVARALVLGSKAGAWIAGAAAHVPVVTVTHTQEHDHAATQRPQ
jgi:hypothetical protein